MPALMLYLCWTMHVPSHHHACTIVVPKVEKTWSEHEFYYECNMRAYMVQKTTFSRRFDAARRNLRLVKLPLVCTESIIFALKGRIMPRARMRAGLRREQTEELVMAKMDWKRFFNAAYETRKDATAAQESIMAEAAEAASAPGYLPNWMPAAQGAAAASGGMVEVPPHVVVDLARNWQMWLADGGSHRIDDEYERLSANLASKAKGAKLPYPLLVRPGVPCGGSGCIAADASSIARALADASAKAAGPSETAVLLAVPESAAGGGKGSAKAVATVDFAGGTFALTPEPGDGGALASAVSDIAAECDPPLGVAEWAFSLAKGDGDGPWFVLDMTPGPAKPAEPEKPQRKRAYSFDEEGRLVDPDGYVFDDDDGLASGFTPTLDDDGEVPGIEPPILVKPRPDAGKAGAVKVKPRPDAPSGAHAMTPKKEAFLIKMGQTEGASLGQMVSDDGQDPEPAVGPAPADPEEAPAPVMETKAVPEVVDTVAAEPVEAATGPDDTHPVDGDQPPAGIVEAIPDWLMPMYKRGETLVCRKRGEMYEFCVFDENYEEGWAYRIDPSTMELKLLREPNGKPVDGGGSTIQLEEATEPAGGTHEAPADAGAVALPGADVAATPVTERKVVPDAKSENENALQAAGKAFANVPDRAAEAPADDVEAPVPAASTMQPVQDVHPAAVVGNSVTEEPETNRMPAGSMEPGEQATEPPSAAGGPTTQGQMPERAPLSPYLASRPELEHVEGRTFGEFLSDLMGARGMRAQDLAKLLGVSTSSVYHYCSNSKRPSFNSLKFISDYFECDVFKW